ncbi:hypothetical protein [Cetobacterium sp.]
MATNEEIRNQHIADIKKIQDQKQKEEESIKDTKTGKYEIRG